MTPQIVYASNAQCELLARLARVARTSAEILITGPTGVGKELYATYAHSKSARCDKPFVAVNCANLSSEILENEIFGHAKGAFTGALSATTGIAAAADGGTLFLDEIDALSKACQAKILRFAELHEYRRLGEPYVRKSDARLIAASNSDLLAKVRDGSFREDLYFRLRVVPIEIPPLADRPEDVSPLLAHFIAHYANEYRVKKIELSLEAVARLHSYPWPGNVRELENCVRYLTCLGLDHSVPPEELPLLDLTPPPPPGSESKGEEPNNGDAPSDLDADTLLEMPLKEAKSMVVEGFERLYIDTALRKADGNVSAAARASGKHRRAFFELMRCYGICGSAYRGK